MCGRKCEGGQVAPLARGTRTMKQRSFDTRSGSHLAALLPGCLPLWVEGESEK